MKNIFVTFIFATILGAGVTAFAGERARDLGMIIGDFSPGTLDAITDVAGVRVGQVTLNWGSGPLVVGQGPVRTGVTVIIPADGDILANKLFAGSYVFSGNGEATGLMYLNERGVLENPIALTNTQSIGAVNRGLMDVMLLTHPNMEAVTPMVLECDDSALNDINGQHVEPKHVMWAYNAATQKVDEGNVGAGTGMESFDFKSGIGTASRLVPIGGKTYTIGVLLNSNLGAGIRRFLRMDGVPVGTEITDLLPIYPRPAEPGAGSTVVVVATDAPLDSRQLSRVAKRAMDGVIRVGSNGLDDSGELAVAFSSGNRVPESPTDPLMTFKMLSDPSTDSLFEAVGDAAEEAFINSMLAATDMAGADGHTFYGIPHDRLKQVLTKYNVTKKGP